MDDWKAIFMTAGAALVSGAGIQLFGIFTKRGTDAGKTAMREHSRREIKRIELTGDAQKDLARIAERMYDDQREGQDERAELYGKIASLETANNALRESFAKMKGERDVALADNSNFVAKISELLVQAKDLSSKLAHRELEFAKLSIEHEGAKGRIEKMQTMIDEMQMWLDDAIAREARLEAENERLRSRT